MVRPPYVALVRLCSYAERYWAAIDGEADEDIIQLPLDRFCNKVQWWVTQRVKDVDHFLAELERPVALAGQPVTDHDLERDAESFMAFASAMGIKPPSVPPTEATA